MPIFLIFLLSISLLGAATTPTDDCTPPRNTCRKHGPVIRFPFRFKSQPEHCGFPGFEVSCDENRNTLLTLPSALTFTVKRIEYGLQQLQLSDPKNCLPLILPDLDLSGSPFNFVDDYVSDYVLFNCSSPDRDYSDPIQCLSGSSYTCYAVNDDVSMDSFSLTSCTRFDNVSSVPRDVFYGNDLHLNWSTPACGHCEVKEKGCALANATAGNQTTCVHRDIERPSKYSFLFRIYTLLNNLDKYHNVLYLILYNK